MRPERAGAGGGLRRVWAVGVVRSAGDAAVGLAGFGGGRGAGEVAFDGALGAAADAQERKLKKVPLGVWLESTRPSYVRVLSNANAKPTASRTKINARGFLPLAPLLSWREFPCFCAMAGRTSSFQSGAGGRLPIRHGSGGFQ